MDINRKITNRIVKKILENIQNKKKDKILCLGVTYKENVDDIRESPAIKIIDKLKKHVKNINIYDPLNKSLNTLNEKKLKNYKFDLVVFLVKHNKFTKLSIKSKKVLNYRY
jgi:UDP-N-acetyl-D-mannosaminuronate dehydrogenase